MLSKRLKKPHRLRLPNTNPLIPPPRRNNLPIPPQSHTKHIIRVSTKRPLPLDSSNKPRPHGFPIYIPFLNDPILAPQEDRFVRLRHTGDWILCRDEEFYCAFVEDQSCCEVFVYFSFRLGDVLL